MLRIVEGLKGEGDIVLMPSVLWTMALLRALLPAAWYESMSAWLGPHGRRRLVSMAYDAAWPPAVAIAVSAFLD